MYWSCDIEAWSFGGNTKNIKKDKLLVLKMSVYSSGMMGFISIVGLKLFRICNAEMVDTPEYMKSASWIAVEGMWE